MNLEQKVTGLYALVFLLIIALVALFITIEYRDYQEEMQVLENRISELEAEQEILFQRMREELSDEELEEWLEDYEDEEDEDEEDEDEDEDGEYEEAEHQDEGEAGLMEDEDDEEDEE